MNKIVHFESNNALNLALLTTWQIHTQEWFPDKSPVIINEGTWQVHKQEWFPDKFSFKSALFVKPKPK